MHEAFISSIGLPGEVYAVFIEFSIIQTPYTVGDYKLSKVGTPVRTYSETTIYWGGRRRWGIRDFLPRVLIVNLLSYAHVSIGYRKICQGWGQERSSLKVSEVNLKEIKVLSME